METSASNTENHWSQTTITNVTIVKKFDILWELPKGDTDMEWANAVGKMVPVDFLTCFTNFLLKTKQKKNPRSGNCNKTRYACISKESNKKNDSKIKG